MEVTTAAGALFRPMTFSGVQIDKFCQFTLATRYPANSPPDASTALITTFTYRDSCTRCDSVSFGVCRKKADSIPRSDYPHDAAERDCSGRSHVPQSSFAWYL